MTIACSLLHQHIQTLVEDNAQWQKLIADDIVWELTYEGLRPEIGTSSAVAARTGSKYSRRNAILPRTTRRKTT